MMRTAPFLVAALGLGLAGCTNPYDPVQRGLGGGLFGAASGAAIGAAAGGGPGAALGAAIGGATGIFGGVATTPPAPPGTYYGYPVYGYPFYGYPVYGYASYGYPAYTYPAHPPPAYGYLGYSGPSGYPPQALTHQGGAGYPLHPSSPVYGSSGDLASPPYPGTPGYEYQRPPFYPPEADAAHGSPMYGYDTPGDRSFEDWSPGPGIVTEPSS